MAYSTLRTFRLICSDRAIFAVIFALHHLWSNARKARVYATFPRLTGQPVTSILPSPHAWLLETFQQELHGKICTCLQARFFAETVLIL